MQRFLNILKIILKVLQIATYCVIGLLITYAIVFSIAGSVVLYKGYKLIKKPVHEVIIYQHTNPKQTRFMKQCLRELKADTLLPDTLLHTFIPFDSISPNLVSAVLAAEDDGFYLHPGIDIASVLAATENNRALGKNRYGASTITQQMAKNLFLSDERTFERKLRELVYALLMERYLGKDRILELYLNYAQWGRNIFGCEAASQFYYKKSARKLSRSEAARLAAVLAKPAKLTPFHTKSVFMSKRITVIAQNLYLHHTIDDSGYFALTGSLPPSMTEDKTKKKSDLPGIKKEKKADSLTERKSF